jgi:KDO2-lipid IV(A) lauroyltransferase
MKIVKYILEAFCIYVLFFLIRILGLNLGRKISGSFFLKIGFFFRSKKLIKKNILTALGNISDSEIKIITKSMWLNYASTFAEYVYLDKFRLNKFSKPRVNISGKEILDSVIKSKKPAIFISGHFGNFELMAMELDKYKINLAAIYRPLNNIFLNPLMVFLRKKYICKNQIEKGLTGTRQIIEFVKKNYSIALMVDQRLSESDRYPFFNKPAHTTTLPAQLAFKFNCDIIPIYLERTKDNFFNMDILEPIKIIKTGNLEDDKKKITIKINQIIEKMVLKNPKQWIWTHSRWK